MCRSPALIPLSRGGRIPVLERLRFDPIGSKRRVARPVLPGRATLVLRELLGSFPLELVQDPADERVVLGLQLCD